MDLKKNKNLSTFVGALLSSQLCGFRDAALTLPIACSAASSAGRSREASCLRFFYSISKMLFAVASHNLHASLSSPQHSFSSR